MLLDILHTLARRRYEAMGFRSRQLEVSAATLHYLVRDHPEPAATVVFVHGLGTSSSSWSKILPLIRGPFRLLALDLPGFGFSAVKNPRGYCGLSDQVGALEEFLDALGVQPVVLVGHSLGGWVGAHVALRQPRRIEHLILVDAAGVYFDGVERSRDLFTLRSVKDTRKLLNNLWYRYPWYFKPFAVSIHKELIHRHMNEIVESIETGSILGEELSALTMPVSLVWGREDRVIVPGSMKVFQKFIPHANTFLIDRCGHVPQLERPAEFASILNTLLNRKNR